MERYETYKDSGIEWIGEIPAKWRIFRLKELLSAVPHALADGPFGSDMKSEEYQDSGVPITQLNNIKEGVHKDDTFKYVSEEKAETLASHYIYPGELLMAKMMPAGRTCIASDAYPKYLLSSDSIRIVPMESVDRRYLCYAANAYANTEAELMSTGTTRVRINLGIVRNMRFAIPPTSQQVAIVDYLDAKTAEIDALVADCEREVELLREYRKAVISEAVTKGLDPNAPMKDSGIEWIGEIPSKWLIVPFKSVAWVAADLRHPSEFPHLMQVSPERIEKDTGKLLPCDTVEHVGVESDNHIFHRGDILYSKVRPALNKVTIAPFDGMCSADMYPIVGKCNQRWLMYYMLSHAFMEQVVVSTDRVKMPKLNKEELGSFKVVLPLESDQDRIASFLDSKTLEIDSLIDAKQLMTVKLCEYRRSLISEAVTGKFKVPGVQQ